MKTFLSIFVTIIALAACQNAETKTQAGKGTAGVDSASLTTIKWIDSVKDIGMVNAGTKAQIKFAFKNSGDKPLLIKSAHPGCGCTVADYPKEAIVPGGQGVITAEYTVPANGEDHFRKNITVFTNTKEVDAHNIYFFGNIKKSSDSSSAGKASSSETNQ